MGDEYYSIGTAYLDLGKFPQSEQWFLKARSFPKNRQASLYNLGRIYYETKRYEESAQAFDEIVKKDPENIIALKSSAYARIKLGTLDAFRQAMALYERVVALVPDSPDSGYNFALVLFALKEYGRAESVLLELPETRGEIGDPLLLLARTQKALGKVESIDSYGEWLDEWDDPKVMVEYAEACESAGFFARAVEAYDMVFESIKAGGKDASGLNEKGALRFQKSRVLLVSGEVQGLEELALAFSEGFDDLGKIEPFIEDERISTDLKEGILELLAKIKNQEEEEQIKE